MQPVISAVDIETIESKVNCYDVNRELFLWNNPDVNEAKCGEALACPEGIEPPTHSLEGCCSIQLSYGQTDEKKALSGPFAQWSGR